MEPVYTNGHLTWKLKRMATKDLCPEIAEYSIYFENKENFVCIWEFFFGQSFLLDLDICNWVSIVSIFKSRKENHRLQSLHSISCVVAS